MEQMIPVFLHDTFYLIQGMELQEVMMIANTEGLNSAKIRARAGFQANVDFYNSAMLKSHLPNMQMGFFEVGDKFIIKPISDMNDLEYFIGPDGRKYTCEAAYYNSPYRFVVDAQVEEEELEADAAAAQLTEAVEESNKQFIQIEEEQSDEEMGMIVAPRQFINPPVQEESKALVPVIPLMNEYTIDTEEKIEEAKFLDGLLSRQYHISKYVKGESLTDVGRYLSESKEDLDREVKIPFLQEANILESIDGDLGSDTVENAVGSSNNMLDSLLTFPVFSALVGKKKLNERFSLLGLTGSQFVRICPVGVSEDGDLYGFVHMEEVSVAAVSKAESEIRQMLKDTGKNFNKLSSQEKYKLFEEKIAEFYSKNAGKMLRASGSDKYVNIVEFLSNMGGKKYAIPDVYDDEAGMMLWPSHEIISFDNRGPKSLEEQLTEKYAARSQEQTHEEERVIALPASTAKFVEPQEEEQVAAPNVIQLPPSPFEAELMQARAEQQTREENTSLIDSILQFAGTESVEGLTVRDSSGEVLDQVSTVKKGPKPVAHTKQPKLPGMLIPEGTVTMGGVNPQEPAKFVDEQGRVWASKEARDKVLAAIFGDAQDQDTVKKK